MGEFYERRLASLLIKKHNLAPPVDIEKLAGHYAKVFVGPVSTEADGACFSLKTPDATIVVNSSNKSIKRMRFTLAHELGHVLIPWHVGDFLDEDVAAETVAVYESEANRFAAELLMPFEWVLGTLSDSDNDLPRQIRLIATSANVSFFAALIRYFDLAPSNRMYALCSSDGVVISARKTSGTLVHLPERGTIISPSKDANKPSYPFKREWCEPQTDGKLLYLWTTSTSLKSDKPAQGNWRQLLKGIFDDIGFDEAEQKQLWGKVAGVMAAANSDCKSRHIEEVVGLINYRMDRRSRDSAEFRSIVNHPDYKQMIASRATEMLVSKDKKKQ